MIDRSLAILIAGLLIAAAILFVFRWQISAATGGIVYQLDRWSGHVDGCLYAGGPCRRLGE